MRSYKLRRKDFGNRGYHEHSGHCMGNGPARTRVKVYEQIKEEMVGVLARVGQMELERSGCD